jgi:hypothetical protein
LIALIKGVNLVFELDKSKGARTVEEVDFLAVVAETVIALVLKAAKNKRAGNLDSGFTFFRQSAS